MHCSTVVSSSTIVQTLFCAAYDFYCFLRRFLLLSMVQGVFSRIFALLAIIHLLHEILNLKGKKYCVWLGDSIGQGIILLSLVYIKNNHCFFWASLTWSVISKKSYFSRIFKVASLSTSCGSAPFSRKNPHNIISLRLLEKGSWYS